MSEPRFRATRLASTGRARIGWRSLAIGVVVVLWLLLPAVGGAFAVRMLAPRLLMNEYVTGIAPSTGGGLWFVTNEGRVGRITPSGHVSEFHHGVQALVETGGSGHAELAAGPGLWYAAQAVGANGQGAIARIATNGRVSEYPAGVGHPASLTVGADGAVWYLSGLGLRAMPAVERMDTSGHVETFPTPGLAVNRLLAVGRQLWFMTYSGQIGRISITGSVTVVPLPAGVLATDLVAGADGGVWFADRHGQTFDPSLRLGYVTAQGRVALLGTKTANFVPFAPASNRLVWYESYISGFAPFDLGLISSTGQILVKTRLTEVTDRIVAGPGDALWFAGWLTALVHAVPGYPGLAVEQLMRPDTTLGELIQTSRLRSDCLVPRLTALPLQDVTQRLSGIGCAYRTVKPTRIGAHRPLIVQDQHPPAGTIIPTNQPVTLTLKSAPSSYGRCRAPQGTVAVLRTGTIVILHGQVSQHGTPTVDSTWGCQLNQGRLWSLFQVPLGGEDGSYALNFRAAGDRVAFETNGASHYGQYFYALVAFNLRTGRRTLTLSLPDQPQALAINANGFVAWQNQSPPSPDPFNPSVLPAHGQIHAHDSTGTHLLDTTGPLDSWNLHFTDNTLHWTDNTTPRQATLH